MNGLLGKKYLHDYIEKTKPLLEDYLVRKEKQSKIQGDLPAEIVRAFAEIAYQGKRIRGSLLTLGFRLFGGKYDRQILKTSLAVEIAHSAILIHDDIMDKADKRRGIISHHKYFENKAKVLGIKDPEHFGQSLTMDGFLSFHYYAWDLLLNSGYPIDRVAEAGRTFSHYIQRVSDGQTLDMAGMYLGEFNKDYILKVLKLKTAEYTGVMPLEVGAILAGAKDAKKLAALKAYGLEFGWAFQIQDDILGMFGDENEVGKPVDSDLAEGKKTLLILHLSENGTPKQKKFMKQVLGKEGITKTDIAKMQNILKDCGAYDAVIAEGYKHVEKGKKYIPLITKDKEMQKLLESLIVYMMERTL